MPLLKIITYGHPLLREKAVEITGVDDRVRDLLASMAETMYANDGVGLAATQVGWMERAFVVDVGPGDGDREDNEGLEEEDPDGEEDEFEEYAEREKCLRVFINPEVISESPEDEPFNEGCLSIPGLRGEVFRPVRIRVRARDENFEPFELDAGGLLARAIQHEIDHLDGVMFVDRLPLLKRSLLAGQLSKLKKLTLEELPALGDRYPIVEAESAT